MICDNCQTPFKQYNNKIRICQKCKDKQNKKEENNATQSQ